MTQSDPSVPSIARVYDFFLGGKDNYAADRALAEQQIAIAALIPVMANENRQFLMRAVDARQWQPGWESTLTPGKREGHVLAAVARV